MAKFVVAGHSDCPYFARVELLGDRLAKNLKKFKLHKIMIQPDQWDQWLKETCQEKGWQFSKSPIVWRELIDRGGKGVLIGGANEFQEYVKAYYDLESDMNSYDMRTISSENKVTKDELDAEEKECKALSNPLHVCITNAVSPTCYHLLNSIASGEVLGPNIEVTIRLLVSSEDDVEPAKGMAMEAEDLAHRNMRSVTVHTNEHEALEDCSVVIMLDEVDRLPEESMRDWLIRNEQYFAKMATVINDKALKTCKVLICGNGPLNFNASVMTQNAPKIARQSIVAVATVVENHAKSVIGERLNVNPAGVVNLVVWGNINGSHYLDIRNCRVHNYDGAVWGPHWYSVSAVEMIHDNKWIAKEFPDLGAARNKRRNTCLSTANAVSTTIKYWCRGSPSGQVFSLGVYSEGLYGVPQGLFFSLPVTMDPKGYWHVVQDNSLTKEVKEGIDAAVKDIIFEQQIFRGEVQEETAEGAEPAADTSNEENKAEKEEKDNEGEKKAEEGEKNDEGEKEKESTDPAEAEVTAPQEEVTSPPEGGEVTEPPATEEKQGEEEGGEGEATPGLEDNEGVEEEVTPKEEVPPA